MGTVPPHGVIEGVLFESVICKTLIYMVLCCLWWLSDCFVGSCVDVRLEKALLTIGI